MESNSIVKWCHTLDCYKGKNIKIELNISIGIEYQNIEIASNILCNL